MRTYPPLPTYTGTYIQLMSSASGVPSPPIPDLRTLLEETYRGVAQIQGTLFTSEEKVVLSKLNDADRAIMLGTKNALVCVLAQVLIQQNIPLPGPLS